MVVVVCEDFLEEIMSSQGFIEYCEGVFGQKEEEGLQGYHNCTEAQEQTTELWTWNQVLQRPVKVKACGREWRARRRMWSRSQRMLLCRISSSCVFCR